MYELSSNFLHFTASIFDRLESNWESQKMQRALGSLMVLTFLVLLIIIQLKFWNILPENFIESIPKNHFFAIQITFTLLLIFEIVSLIFSLSKSVSTSMAKQFEIFSLILLRKAFKEIGQLSKPIDWFDIGDTLTHIFSDAGAAVLIFAGIAIFKTISKHRPITTDSLLQEHFNFSKKLIGLSLLFTFVGLAIFDVGASFFTDKHHYFFTTFYTILIFSDVLLVIISLRYNFNYLVIFRNSGFALATVLLRLSLSAPFYYNMILGIGAMLLVIFISYIYNRFPICDDLLVNKKDSTTNLVDN